MWLNVKLWTNPKNGPLLREDQVSRKLLKPIKDRKEAKDMANNEKNVPENCVNSSQAVAQREDARTRQAGCGIGPDSSARLQEALALKMSCWLFLRELPALLRSSLRRLSEWVQPLG